MYESSLDSSAMRITETWVIYMYPMQTLATTVQVNCETVQIIAEFTKAVSGSKTLPNYFNKLDLLLALSAFWWELGLDDDRWF